MAEQIPGTVVRRSATIGWYDRQVPDVRPPDYAGRRYRATVCGTRSPTACSASSWKALPLIRTISGDGYGTEVEQRCMEVMLEAQGPDGLVYLPKAGRPWCVFKTYGKEPPGDHYVSRWFEGGSWALRDLPSVPPGAVGRPVARERRVPRAAA